MCLRLYQWRVETKANGLSQPFERLAELVGSLISISEVRGLSLNLHKNLSHTIYITWICPPPPLSPISKLPW